MKIKLLTLTFLSCMSFLAICQERYDVGNIEDTLLHNVNAVVRLMSTVVEVKSVSDVTTTHHYVITILNKEADDLAKFQFQYDDERSKVKDLDGYIYNRHGKEVESLQNSDILDLPLLDGTFESDIRQKFFELDYDDYPYTIEVRYTLKEDYLLWLPTWTPYPKEHTSIEEARFIVGIPKDIGFRYKTFNLEEPNIVQGGAIEEYSWRLENLFPLKDELYSPSTLEFVPVIFTAPNFFSYDGHSGNIGSWESYGQWIQGLNDLVAPLPESKKQEIRELVNDIPDKRKRTKVVYEYLQNNTRYRSIQLGIGGFKPLDPAFVAEKGYGECKALTFYTKSLLSAVNIDSYYTLAKAGAFENDILLDFPSSQFNHVFLCVPIENDTIWLECTSQDNPFGYIGSFTGSRNVLVINGEGTKFVKTPSYKEAPGNTINTGAKVVVNENGAARVTAKTVYRGLEYERVSHLLDKPRRERQDWLYKEIEIPSFSINDFKVTLEGEEDPKVTINTEIFVKRHAKISGKRLFLPLNIMDNKEKKLKKTENRNTSVELKYGYIQTDTVQYQLPSDFHPEYIPETTELKTEFGWYRQEVIVNEDKVTYIRRLQMKKGKHPPESYNKLVDFKNEIRSKDMVKMVLVNKT